MELFTIFWRTVLIYFVIFIVIRMMGKREIGKLSVFDLVISIMIAEIAVFIIDDPEMPIVHGILPMITLVFIQIAIALITLKNRTIRLWFDGKPSYLIENGKLNQDEMRKQRYTLDDLIMQLREREVPNLADVEFAVLETSGKLSVIEKEKEKRSGPGSSGPDVSPGVPGFRYEGLPLALIMDGKVQDDSLEKIGKTRFWLKNELQAKGVNDFKDVFFCSIDHRGRLFLDKKKR
ncbi:DUF421 domain-containing protein [Paenibacillus flagellatus]|uniref:DUF421 domain-containing protein n=1 Tax=Paenibacillus flagellatus TaxID=2211139 RepID=A0A2V5KV45_9BACL|nr:DUF421 domain-containing protein [Paenibacillus flagellatus]PYI53316.1 DUF421 domain-containing protein [Paenibacillus flagellatus]